MTLLGDFEASIRTRYGPGGKKAMHKLKPLHHVRKKTKTKAHSSQRIVLDKIYISELSPREEQHYINDVNSAKKNQEEDVMRNDASSWMNVLDDAVEEKLLMNEAPSSLAESYDIDLSKWSVIVTDNTFKRIAHYNRRKTEEAKTNPMRRGSIVWNAKLSLDKKQRNYVYRVVANGAEQVTDRGLRSIGVECDQLEVLELSHAIKITDAGMRILSLNCTNLQRLNIGHCRNIQGHGLSAIADHCSYMKWLSVSHCSQLESWVLFRLFIGFPKLLHLNLSSCIQVDDAVIKVLALRCPHLETLNLNNCHELTDMAFGFIGAHCGALKDLRVSRTRFPEKITDIGILSISEGCTNLIELDISGNSFVTDVGIKWLAMGCPLLRVLYMNRCHRVSDVGMNSLSEGCTDLLEFHVMGNKAITNIGLRYVASKCSQLIKVNFSGLFLISDGDTRDFGIEGMQAVVFGCPQLLDINISMCFQVIERSLIVLSKTCKNLQKLNIRGCKNVTETAMVAISRGCRQLKTLNVGYVDTVNVRIVKSLARNCKSLVDLNLSYCTKVDDSCMAALGRIANRLLSLNISGCTLVGNLGMEKFSSRFKHPRILHLILNECLCISTETVAKLGYRCPDVLTLGLVGCQVPRQVLKHMAHSWKYTELRISKKEYGFYPKHRASDCRFIDKEGALWVAAMKIQSLYRNRKAAEELVIRREMYLMNMVATRLQSMWRARQGRRVAFLRKLLFGEKERAAIAIQRAYRARGTVREADKEIQILADVRLVEACIFVQKTWRLAKSNILATSFLNSWSLYQKALHAAAIVVQRRWRGISGRYQFNLSKSLMRAQNEEREESASQLQKLMRGRASRKRTNLQRKKRLEGIKKTHRASAMIQMQWRKYLARCEIVARKLQVIRREQAALTLQTLFRTRKEKKKANLRSIVFERIAHEKAAFVLQKRWRTRKDRLGLLILFQARAQKMERERQAACQLQHFFRHRLEWKHHQAGMFKLLAAKRSQDAFIEHCVITIQKAWRRRHDQQEYQILLHAKRQVWKELIDYENVNGFGEKAPFYFNQLNGALRRRTPAVLVHNITCLSSCDQCEEWEGGTIECADCGEFFCTECSNIVHGGGLRSLHNTRRVVDYYGNFMDHGEGTFPTIWPHEWKIDQLRCYDFERRVPLLHYDAVQEAIEKRNREIEQETMATRGAEGESSIDESIWSKWYDDENGFYYYYDELSGISTYTRPDGDGRPRGCLRRLTCGSYSRCKRFSARTHSEKTIRRRPYLK